MMSFSHAMDEYRRQLQRGHIQHAYQGLMEYIRELRALFAREFPAYGVSGGIQYGYMDLTYFTLAPEAFKKRKLKFAVLFDHEAFRFEVWLSGMNKRAQVDFWRRLKESDWSRFELASDPEVSFFILQEVIVENPNFTDAGSLTALIRNRTVEFISSVEGFLADQAV